MAWGDGSLYLESVRSQQRRTFAMRSERRSCCSELCVCSSSLPRISSHSCCISRSHPFLLLLLPPVIQLLDPSGKKDLHRLTVSLSSFFMLHFPSQTVSFSFASRRPSPLNYTSSFYSTACVFGTKRATDAVAPSSLLPLCEYRLTV